MSRSRCLVLLSCWAGLLPLPAVADANHSAEAATPLASANRNPFTLISGLPVAAPAALLAEGQSRLDLTAEWANTATRSERGEQQITLDGETVVTTLNWQYGWREDWQLGLSLPWIRHSGGRLDDFIESWHDTFGLPNGERDAYPVDQLDYHYRDGDDQGRWQQPVSGIGDTQLQLSRALRSGSNYHYSWRNSLKIPTGDADRLTGSGGWELASALHYDRSQWHWQALSFQGSLGVLLSEKGEVLPAQREPLALYGSSMLAWQWSEWLQLKMQLDFHSALYDSEFAETGKGSVQWLLGGSFALAPNWQMDLAISEDIAVNTAPDVLFLLALRWTTD